MPGQRRIPLFVWLSAPVVLTGGLVWLLVSKQPQSNDATNDPSAGQQQRSFLSRLFGRSSPQQTPPGASAGGAALAETGQAGEGQTARDIVAERMREVLEMGKSPATNLGQLVTAYGKWASEPAALIPRKMILDALLRQEDPMARVASLLQAANASTLPPQEDPLFRQAVDGIAKIWSPQNIQAGLDMMTSEERSHPRQLLISSLAEYAVSARSDALNEKQRMAVLSDFIDIKTKAPSSTLDEIEGVIRKLSPPLLEDG